MKILWSRIPVEIAEFPENTVPEVGRRAGKEGIDF